ncbi:hypothetical protein OTK49_01325 [Vibrio coralliirubri]|uniref:hypothetical protein n=1 Tax=Vibrio coralliirubri TaxID=1516159 RepID=UPI002283E303|nr:hypothetical protein [Vibrio coralliirubri]MCY9861170.1 hypothetical protein [Vibrio coralliirubri]
MLKATTSLFVALIALLSIPAFASVPADEDPYSCDVYVDKGGHSTPKPFSSTICPKDKALKTTLYHFPSTMEAAINLTGLEYKDQIISYLRDSRSASNGTPSEDNNTTGAHYQNDISNFEASSIAIRELTLWLITVIVVAQLIGLSFVAMRSGEVGGKKYGMFKTFTRIAIGFILITPISIHSEVSGTSADVLFIQILMGVAVLAALGMANIAVSTSAYMMTADVVDSQGYLSIDSAVAEGIANIASVKSRILIEDAVCANQTALLGVYDGAEAEGQGAYATLSEGGAGLLYSTKGDSSNTLIEYGFDENTVNIQTGFYLDSEHGSPLICSESTITKPAFGLPSATLSAESYKTISEDIESIAKKYDLSDFRSAGGIKEDLLALRGKIYQYLEDDQFALISAGGVPNITKVNSLSTDEAMTHVINYFFDLLRFRLNGGMLAEQDQDILDLFDRRAKLADEFSKMLIESKCYAYRNDYIDTKNTIKALNGGDINSGDFSLKCAVVDGVRLEMPFDADTTSVSSFAADALKVATKNQTRLQDAYIALYHSFEDYDSQLEIARYEATKENAISLLKQNLTDDFDSRFEGFSRKLREEGVASFAYNSMGFTKLATQSLNKVVDNQFIYKVGISDSYKASYSSESNFLPSGSLGKQSSADDFMVQMPEFIYALPEDTSNVEQLADSQLFTQQGGSFDDSGNRIDLVDQSNEAVTNLIGKSQTLTLLEKSQLSIDADFNAILRQYSGVGIAAEELQDLFKSSENYFAIVSQCGVPDAVTGIKDKFGDAGVRLFASVCYRYTQHYIFYAQDLGQQVLNLALGMFLANRIVKSFSELGGVFQRSSKGAVEKVISDKGNPEDETGNKASRKTKAKNKAANALSSIKDTIPKGVKALIDPMEFITKFVAIILLLVGFALSFLVPLIPIVSHLLSYLGWLMLVFQLMIISSIIVLTFFMFTDQDDPSSSPEKAANGAFINILFRPIAIIIGVVTAFILSYVAYIMMDLTISNMIFGLSETTDVMAYNPVKVVLATMTLAVVIFAYVFVLKTIFDVSLKAPNNILQKMGAETVDARETKATAAVFALVSKSTSQVSEEMNVAEQINKRRVKEIIRNSRKSDLKDVVEINRALGSVVTDNVHAGVLGAAGTLKNQLNSDGSGVLNGSGHNEWVENTLANAKGKKSSVKGSAKTSSGDSQKGSAKQAKSGQSSADKQDEKPSLKTDEKPTGQNDSKDDVS